MTWQVQVFLGRDASGRRQLRRVTARTKRACARAAAAMLTDSGRGDLPDAGAMTFGELRDRWLASLVHISPSSRRRYGDQVRLHMVTMPRIDNSFCFAQGGQAMPQPRRKRGDPGGPYVATAFFCEDVKVDKNGRISFLRVVDQVINRGAGDPVTVTLVLSFWPGTGRGSVTLRVVLEEPSGLRVPQLESAGHMEGEERVTSWRIPIIFSPERPGLYWFEAWLDEQLMTKVPLRVIYRATRLLAAQEATG